MIVLLATTKALITGKQLSVTGLSRAICNSTKSKHNTKRMVRVAGSVYQGKGHWPLLIINPLTRQGISKPKDKNRLEIDVPQGNNKLKTVEFHKILQQQGGGKMTGITGGQPPIQATEIGLGLATLQQQSKSGEQQTITLDVHQAESLQNWLVQFVRETREEISQE